MKKLSSSVLEATCVESVSSASKGGGQFLHVPGKHFLLVEALQIAGWSNG